MTCHCENSVCIQKHNSHTHKRIYANPPSCKLNRLRRTMTDKHKLSRVYSVYSDIDQTLGNSRKYISALLDVH